MAELIIETARSGDVTLKIGGQYLHSRYDPFREAKKFLENTDLPNRTVCILLCPGLNYLSKVIRHEYPHIQLIAIHPSTQFEQLLSPDFSQMGNLQQWSPSSSLTLENFLIANINDCDATMSELLIWAPALAIYGDFCDQALQVIRQYLKAAQANFMTAAYFGKKWLRNSIKNLSHLSNLTGFILPDCPVFLAASGPGLMDILPVIKQYRNRICLWALPSSIRALAYYEIQPDVIVTSDAGYWAGRHLDFIPDRWLRSGKLLILCPIRAMLRPLYGKSCNLVIHSSGESFEQYLLSAISVKSLSVIPDRGTVAATAIELLLHNQVQRLFIAGLDFANLDLFGHVRPHSFDDLPYCAGHRTDPVYHQLYRGLVEANSTTLHDNWKSFPNLEIYRSWFEKRNFASAVFSHDYNPSQISKGFQSNSLDQIKDYLENLTPQIDTSAQLQRNSLPVGNPNIVELLTDLLIKLKSQSTTNAIGEKYLLDFLNLVAPFAYRDWWLAKSKGNTIQIEIEFSNLLSTAQIFVTELLAESESWLGNKTK